VSGRTVAFAGFELELDEQTDLSAYEGRTVILGIRPSDLEDASIWNTEMQTIEVRADITEELGSEVNVIFTVDAPPVATEETLAAVSDEEEELVPLIVDRCQFCARVDPRTRCRPGDTIRLAVDPSRFHFFDRDTGRAIQAREVVGARA
jgi:multiple sugar transport system ATP-binding protein